MTNKLIVKETEIEVDGVVYIEKTTYRVLDDGSKEVACSTCRPKATEEAVMPEPTQLDRIESMLKCLLEKVVKG